MTVENELELAQSELRAVKNASQDTKKLHNEACLQVEELQGDNRSLLARVASLREQLLAHRGNREMIVCESPSSILTRLMFRPKQVVIWLSFKVQKGDCRVIFTESRYEA